MNEIIKAELAPVTPEKNRGSEIRVSEVVDLEHNRWERMPDVLRDVQPDVDFHKATLDTSSPVPVEFCGKEQKLGGIAEDKRIKEVSADSLSPVTPLKCKETVRVPPVGGKGTGQDEISKGIPEDGTVEGHDTSSEQNTNQNRQGTETPAVNTERTPRRKPKTKRLRPKVVVEDKSKKSSKKARLASERTQENPPTKRQKRGRKKEPDAAYTPSSAQAEDTPSTAQGETNDPMKIDVIKPVKRSLDFDTPSSAQGENIPSSVQGETNEQMKTDLIKPVKMSLKFDTPSSGHGESTSSSVQEETNESMKTDLIKPVKRFLNFDSVLLHQEGLATWGSKGKATRKVRKNIKEFGWNNSLYASLSYQVSKVMVTWGSKRKATPRGGMKNNSANITNNNTPAPHDCQTNEDITNNNTPAPHDCQTNEDITNNITPALHDCQTNEVVVPSAEVVCHPNQCPQEQIPPIRCFKVIQSGKIVSHLDHSPQDNQPGGRPIAIFMSRRQILRENLNSLANMLYGKENQRKDASFAASQMQAIVPATPDMTLTSKGRQPNRKMGKKTGSSLHEMARERGHKGKFTNDSVFPDPLAAIIWKMKCLSITVHSDGTTLHLWQQSAIVPYGSGGTMVTFDSSLHSSSKRKPRAKVDLDSETNKAWMLLMEKDLYDAIREANMDNEGYWEKERKVFRGRVDLFVSYMHIVQGDRRFSLWKGSVLDSIGGVFLTQNVSDILSSNAYIELASKYPCKLRRKKTDDEGKDTADKDSQNHDLVFRFVTTIISNQGELGDAGYFNEISNFDVIGDNESICQQKLLSSAINDRKDVNCDLQGELFYVQFPPEDTDVDILPHSEEVEAKNVLKDVSCSHKPEVRLQNSKDLTAQVSNKKAFRSEIYSGSEERCKPEMLEACPENKSQLNVETCSECATQKLLDSVSRSSHSLKASDIPNFQPSKLPKNVGKESTTNFEINNAYFDTADKDKLKGTTDAGEEPIDWDELRRQACSTSGRRERSINNMDSVDWEAVRCADVNEIAHTIRARGQNNRLAERIKDLLNRLIADHGSLDLEWLRDIPPDKAKDYLLSIKGLGLKSVECVRLLALHHVAFPVDTNVARICVRLGWVPLQPLPESVQLHLLELYPILDSIQKYLWPRLCTLDQQTLYELHYQMITFGKVFCTKRKPNCNACPMRGDCKHFASAFASARLALPGPDEKCHSASKTLGQCIQGLQPISVLRPHFLPMETSISKNNYDHVVNIVSLPESGTPDNSDSSVPCFKKCEPIIEEPKTPEPECSYFPELDIEDAFCEDVEKIPTIKLNIERFAQTIHDVMKGSNMEFQSEDISKAIVCLTQEAASIPQPKLKNINRLRTEHQVYELPDNHPLLEGWDQREPDDPCPYLFAMWTPGETPDSTELPKSCCDYQDSNILCNNATCFQCNSTRETQSQLVRGTILIPCRTAMRGSFPLNGTYFQVNEVFADHCSSLCPINVPRKWFWNLPRRIVYFGTSATSIFRGLSTTAIQQCFWKGFVCVRGFDRDSRAPRPLVARLHSPTTKMTKNKKAIPRYIPGLLKKQTTTIF